MMGHLRTGVRNLRTRVRNLRTRVRNLRSLFEECRFPRRHSPFHCVRRVPGCVGRSALIVILLLSSGVTIPGASVAVAEVVLVDRSRPEPQPVPAPVLAARSTPASWTLQLRQLAAETPTPTTDPTLDQLVQQMNDAWNAQDWPEVLRLIDEIMAIDPNYPEILDKKYYAHVNYGYQLMTENNCTESKVQFMAALAIRPDGEEAEAGLELLALYCGTPEPGTGTPTSVTTATATVLVTRSPTSLTPPPTGAPTGTPEPIILTEPLTYTVQPGDTLYGLAKRYSTTVQAIMQANGMMSYFLRAGDTIIIPASGALPAGPGVHIVQPGETLHSIAQQYNTTVWAIMVINGLSSYTIYAYRALFVPSSMQPGPIIHIVQPGETLLTIANTYSTTLPLLMLANDMSTYEITVYQRIIIPPPGWEGYPPISVGTGPGPGPGPIVPLPPGGLYVVQPGDTLYGIARRFGTTVDALKAANGLTSSTIYAGSTLRLP